MLTEMKFTKRPRGRNQIDASSPSPPARSRWSLEFAQQDKLPTFGSTVTLVCFLLVVVVLTGSARSQEVEPRPAPYASPYRPTDTEVRVFRLAYADSASLVQILSDIKKGGSTRIATDRKTNSIIVSATATDLREIEALVQALDRPGQQQESRNADRQPKEHRSVRVHLAWIVGRPLNEKPIPPALQPIVKELEKLGFKSSALATQAVIRTLPGGRFNCTCQFAIRHPASLQAHGTLSAPEGGDGPLTLQIEIGTHDLSTDPKTELSTVQTVISAPLGHPVVLAVNPSGDFMSAFVVTLTPEQ